MTAAAQQLAIPGMGQNAKRPKRNPYAKCWTPDEESFADSLRATWNAVFADHHGTHANKHRRNNSVAVYLHRWIHSPDNEGDPKMTEEDVRVAIKAYSADPWNIKQCNGKFQSFGPWIRGCPDNVDKQLARVKATRGAKDANHPAEKAKAFAAELLRHRGFGEIAASASQVSLTFVRHVEWAIKHSQGRDAEDYRKWYGQVMAVINRFRPWRADTRQRYYERANQGFLALRGRDAKAGNLADDNTIYAIALALFDRGARSPIRPRTSRRGAEAQRARTSSSAVSAPLRETPIPQSAKGPANA